MPDIKPVVLEAIEACPGICAVIYYGASSASITGGELPLLGHIPGDAEEIDAIEVYNIKRYYYARVKSFFAIPAHEDYDASSASVAHTRTLSFLKPLVDGPYFDIEKIWDEHSTLR